MKKFSRGVAAMAGLSLCVFLTQCEEHRELRNQKAELQSRFEQMQQESAELDRHLTEAKKALPPAGSLEEAARQLEARTQKEIATLETQFRESAAALKQTEAEVAALRQRAASAAQ